MSRFKPAGTSPLQWSSASSRTPLCVFVKTYVVEPWFGRQWIRSASRLWRRCYKALASAQRERERESAL